MSTAEDFMTRGVTAVRETVSVDRALRALAELDVRHLPVVNGSDEVVGILSDRDLAPYIDDAGGRKKPVSDVMSADVITVEVETGLDEIIDLFVENRFGAVPVVDGDGRLAGVISYIDVLRQVGRERRGDD